MKAQETTFKSLVQGEKQFQIPLYQRTYSWRREQLERLWDDVCEQASSDQASHTHFLGSVVLAPSPALQASGLQRWLVVDGQQRLTSLMLAMCAIRDHVRTRDVEEADRFNEFYLTNRWRKGDDYFRLLPTRADRPSYVACIEATAEAGGGDSVGAAYRFFREQLLADDQPTATEIENAIATRLALVEITAAPGDNVHRIFESVNNTGLGLTQADLVRNWIFMQLAGRADLIYDSVWLPMQARLTNDRLEDLFFYYLVIHGQERVRRDDIYRGMQRILSVDEGTAGALEVRVRDLERRSQHLQRILEPDKEGDPELRAAFVRLSSWGAQLAYPLCLVLLDAREQQRATDQEVKRALAYLESFLVRRMICGVAPNNLNRILNALAADCAAGAALDDTVRDVLSRERNFWPDDAALTEAVGYRPFYWQGRPNQRQLVLRRLEESYASSERGDLQEVQLSLEHVLPQTPTPEWLDMLAQDADPGQTAEDLHRELVHTLGNLTLTGYNALLKQQSFSAETGFVSSQPA
jgi:hypothetical protein